MFAVSLKCRLGVVRRRDKGTGRAERLASAHQGLGGDALQRLLFLSWAGGKKRCGLRLIFHPRCVLVWAVGSFYFLACCIFFKGWIFSFSPLTLWIFIVSVCHSYYCSKADLGLPWCLTRFPSSHMGDINLQGEALGWLPDTTRLFGSPDVCPTPALLPGGEWVERMRNLGGQRREKQLWALWSSNILNISRSKLI